MSGRGEDVSSSALMLDRLRVRLTLDHLRHVETGGTQLVSHVDALAEVKVERNLDAEHLVEMTHFEPDVETQEQHPSRSQDTPKLGERTGQQRRRNVDDGVEGRDRTERLVGDIGELEHVPLPELDGRIAVRCLVDHGRREVEPADRRAPTVHVCRDLARPAPHIADRAQVTDAHHQPIEHGRVERLVPQLVDEVLGIGRSHLVVVHRPSFYFLVTLTDGTTRSARSLARTPSIQAGRRASRCPLSTAGTVYGVSQKTTVYFPDEMKRAIERESQRRDCSEAQVIRDAVAAAVIRPRPSPGIFEGESLSAHVDELLVGFGER